MVARVRNERFAAGSDRAQQSIELLPVYLELSHAFLRTEQCDLLPRVRRKHCLQTLGEFMLQPLDLAKAHRQHGFGQQPPEFFYRQARSEIEAAKVLPRITGGTRALVDGVEEYRTHALRVVGEKDGLAQ